jgi:hypothetical protein
LIKKTSNYITKQILKAKTREGERAGKQNKKLYEKTFSNSANDAGM